MPWTLVFVLTIYLPLLAVSFYVGRKLLDAITILKGWSRRRIRQVLVGVLGFVNLLPVVFFAAYQLKERVIVPEFAGDNLLVDLLLTYPFWITLVITFQLFILYVVADITKLWILRFFRTQQEWWREIEPRFVVGAFLVILVYSGLEFTRTPGRCELSRRRFTCQSRSARSTGCELFRSPMSRVMEEQRVRR
jgi:hypothetical protein